jgi:5-methylcytosine-specific restriction endonuclease McrA
MSNYKLYAPVCALPHCINKVNYHKRYLKTDHTWGFKWKTFCDDHRTVNKAARDKFIQSRGGCENRDAHLGWKCLDPDTSSLTVDHVDGNKLNSNEDNLEVLCANCHQRKTKLFGDYRNRYTYVTKHFHNIFDEINV